MTTQASVIPMSDVSDTITASDLAPHVLPDSFLSSSSVQQILDMSLPRFEELPDIGLYREQVVSYIESALAPLSTPAHEAWITPAMINNYVKAQLVQAPTKKLYHRRQIARFIIICLFKQFMPIAAIHKIFRMQQVSYPDHVAYNYVIHELKAALTTAFIPGSAIPADSATIITRESLLVRSAVAAFASRSFLMTYLQFAGYEGAKSS
ncbi:DUF1836 domain-containing protein [Collinsella sp. zg1085]|uniref:DUF1836 domain-containing protein n=1 Tax=Collinsella sp. zg1085 TaxID=2844380 RepID=UPI001C0D789E|nr:DUF1836 domain-containing protein [Collinsella sp. zg1085]QWT17009.1 DUF1836 domain-containing protein [Collinsella sp. zg1085]